MDKKKLRFLYILILFISSTSIGYLFLNWGIGLAWMFGAMFASLLMALASKPLFKIETIKGMGKFRRVGQMILGVGIGSMLVVKDILSLHSILFHIFVVVAVSIGLAFALGMLYYTTSSNLSFKTAFFSTIPGGVGIMASIAAEHGGDSKIVGILQSLRIIIVVILVPIFLYGTLLFNGNKPILISPFSLFSTVNFLNLLITLTLSIIGYFIAKKLKITSPALIGPLILSVLVINLIPYFSDFHVLSLLTNLGQMFLGITIGDEIGRKIKEIRIKDLIIGTAVIVMTVLSSIFPIIYLHYLAGVNWQTALLSSAPGGAVEMILLATTMNNVNLEIIVTSQIIRQVLINLLVPFWIYFATKMEKNYFKMEKSQSSSA